MQRTSASQQALSLYEKISASTFSCSTTVCLWNAGAVYVEPQTRADIEFAEALRCIDFRVAIKARSRYIHTLLEDFTPDVRTIHVGKSETFAVVDCATFLPTAQDCTGAILRGENALVLWSMESCDIVASQFRELERRLELAAIFGRGQLTSLTSVLDAGPSKFDIWPVFDLVPPSTLAFTSSSLSSLSELASLHGLDHGSDALPWEPAFDYTEDPVCYSSSDNTGPTPLDTFASYRAPITASPISSSDTTPSTVCLSDISPPPLSVDHESRRLPDDDIAELEFQSDSSPPPRRLSSLPKRGQKPEASPVSSPDPILPRSPRSSPKSALEQAFPSTGGKSYRETPSLPPVTSATPLLSSLNLSNSPPLGTKRKSPSPLTDELPPRRSPRASSSSIITARGHTSPLRESPFALPKADEEMQAEESDLSDTEPTDDEDEEGDYEEDEPAPPAKRTKVVKKAVATAPTAKGPGSRKRGGRGSSQKKKKFTCEDCAAKFSREGDRKRHQDSSCPAAKQVKNFQCSMCPSFFNREDALKRHWRSHHDTTA